MKDLKHVVGVVREGQPATIRFYGEVNEWNCMYFNYEMLWLQEQKPSCINIMINSEGGSVIHGMSTYSVIQDCPVPTECVIEGLAASMGSILWAAGDTRKMRDYSLLMMHNPFYSGNDSDGESDPALKAFTGQLKTIYTTKFGLSEDEIKDIMDGKEGEDGTWLDYKSAIKHGIVSKEDVITSTKGACKKMKNLLTAKASVKDICANVTKELIDMQPNESENSTIKTEENNKFNNKNMELLATVASLVGLSTDAKQEDVFAKLPELAKAKAELDSVKAELTKEKEVKNALEVTLAGEKANGENLQVKLKEAESKLAEYSAKEAEVFKSKIEAMVEEAVKQGKIKAESKPQFVQMAESNFDLVKSTLDNITPAAKISEEIKQDEDKTKAAGTDTVKEAEALIVKAVGSDFKFKTLDK